MRAVIRRNQDLDASTFLVPADRDKQRFRCEAADPVGRGLDGAEGIRVDVHDSPRRGAV